MRVVAYLLVIFVGPLAGMVAGLVAAGLLKPLRGRAEQGTELIEALVEGAGAITAAIALFSLLGLGPGFDLVVLLVLAFAFNDRKRQKRADGMVAAHWALAQKPDFEAAKRIVSQSPVDASGWIKLQKWERVRAWGHAVGIVVAGIGSLIQPGTAV